MTTGTILITLIIVCLLIRFRRALGTWCLSAVGGLAVLGLLRLTAGLTGIAIPFNLFTLLTGTVLGLPGTIGLLLFNLFW